MHEMTSRERRLAAKRAYHRANRERELVRMRERYQARKAEYIARAAARAAQNPEAEKARLKARYLENREAELEMRRAHYLENKAAYVARAKARKALIAERTPPWADTAKIQAVYEEAEAFRSLGLEVHVDHVVPLQGKTVCGLHVHNNLRVILAAENIAKSNKLLES